MADAREPRLVSDDESAASGDEGQRAAALERAYRGIDRTFLAVQSLRRELQDSASGSSRRARLQRAYDGRIERLALMLSAFQAVALRATHRPVRARDRQSYREWLRRADPATVAWFFRRNYAVFANVEGATSDSEGDLAPVIHRPMNVRQPPANGSVTRRGGGGFT